jgi:hypothetical protein
MTTAPAITEKAWLAQVLELADVFGWEHYHAWVSVRSAPGFPDCVLVRPPRALFVELKSEKGKTTPAQDQWLELLAGCPGVEVFVWKPSDFDRAVEVLR